MARAAAVSPRPFPSLDWPVFRKAELTGQAPVAAGLPLHPKNDYASYFFGRGALKGDGPLVDLLAFSQPRRTTHQFVRETLRRAILSGALPGGARLVQADIAAQLDVSTTPVREALRDLAADGLILFDPHRGAIVHELDMTELTEVYEIRKALEPLAIRKAAALISDGALDEAAELQKRMDAESDAGAWAELNRRFHALLEQASASPRLISLVKSVQDTSAIYVAHSLKVDPARIKAGNREHRRLLKALRARDGETAAAIMVEHLDHTLDSIRASHEIGERTEAPAPKRSR